MRRTFGKMIIELAEKDNKILLIVGDIGYGIFDEFRERFPDRFFNVGTCEQSMIGMSAGLALSGFKPYVYTITPFLVERAFEQVKLNIDQQNVNVKLVGYADYPDQGLTHQEILTKDVCQKLWKNMMIYAPVSGPDTSFVLTESYEMQKPTFISLKKDVKLK